MPIADATRRASCRSSSVQQRPKLWGMPSRWSYSCIDSPTTSWPASASRAAATDESTPPDMATTIRIARLAVTTRPTSARHGHPGQRPQLVHQRRQHPKHAVDFGLGVGRSEAEAKRALRAAGRQPHRLEHVRGLERSRRARRPGRHGDAFEVERDEQRLGLDPLEADVGGVVRPAGRGSPLTTVPVTRDRMPASSRSRSAPDAALVSGEIAPGLDGGDAEADHGGHVLGAGAAVPLVAAAGENRRDARAASNPERAGALGAAKLVARQRQQVRAQCARRPRPACPRSGRRRCGTRRRRRARRRPARRWAARSRSRCWRASPTPGRSAASPPGAARRG